MNLVVKRRLVLPPSQDGSSVKVSLAKNKKKDEFGVILGCKIYIKEILHQSLADKEVNLNVGDFVGSINGTSLEGMSLKEARKLLETVKEKLEMVVTKNRDQGKSNQESKQADSDLRTEPQKEIKSEDSKQK